LLFPPADGACSGESYEDDGESEAYREQNFGSWHVGVTSKPNVLCATVSKMGRLDRSDEALALLLPQDESRPVELAGVR
jgi:alpha-glucosidase